MEAQILTLVVAFIAVMIGVLLNNGRLGDIKDVLKAEIKATEAQVQTRASAKDMMDLRVLIEKNHSELLLKLADIENRVAVIERAR